MMMVVMGEAFIGILLGIDQLADRLIADKEHGDQDHQRKERDPIGIDDQEKFLRQPDRVVNHDQVISTGQESRDRADNDACAMTLVQQGASYTAEQDRPRAIIQALHRHCPHQFIQPGRHFDMMHFKPARRHAIGAHVLQTGFVRKTKNRLIEQQNRSYDSKNQPSPLAKKSICLFSLFQSECKGTAFLRHIQFFESFLQKNLHMCKIYRTFAAKLRQNRHVMKRIVSFWAAVMICCAMNIQAVNYCATSSWGYAGNVTGGGNATPTLVTNESQLATALNTKNSVIIITQDITVTNHISSDKSNLTIMALPGKKLISNKQNQDESGILYLKGNNLLLRNLTFVGPGAYDCDGWDNLCLDKAMNVWVDHCDFQDGCDGNFDIKGKADNITVTWCRFRYLKAPKAGGSGGSDDHRFSNLVGSGSSDKPDDGTYNITYGFCWWDEGCKQRMTRCRNCLLHFLNCYWNSSVADYYVGPENASCYFEGCTFAGKANSAAKIWNVFNNTTNYCTFVNCTGNLPANSSTPVAAPTYAYETVSAATAKNMIINSSCGAGATLTVTSTAEVSSSCDGEEPPVDPQPIEGDCCVDLSLGEAPTVSNGGIPAGFSQLSVVANLAKGTWEQGYLNMGGNADYITFDFSAYDAVIEAVEFDVTIPNWEETKNTISYHWNSETNTSYTISSKNTETVQLTAPANAKSFTIQRSAGTSTRISQVCFQIQGNTTGMESVHPTDSSTHKIIREGRLLILRDGKIYTVTGQSL